MTRRPPRSTLFPYPPLFRSSRTRRRLSRLSRCAAPPSTSAFREPQSGRRARRLRRCPPVGARPRAQGERARSECRSEEHTSELQSRQYLVCRLLLEKKEKSE